MGRSVAKKVPLFGAASRSVYKHAYTLEHHPEPT